MPELRIKSLNSFLEAVSFKCSEFIIGYFFCQAKLFLSFIALAMELKKAEA